MAMAAGAQLIVQTAKAGGTYKYLGFAGFPLVNLVFIAFQCINSWRARSLREPQ